MSKAKSSSGGSPFTIVEAMGDSGTLTVRETATGETYEVGAFADEFVRERVKALSPGSTVSLVLTPGGETGETISGLAPGAPAGPFGAD